MKFLNQHQKGIQTGLMISNFMKTKNVYHKLEALVEEMQFLKNESMTLRKENVKNWREKKN